MRLRGNSVCELVCSQVGKMLRKAMIETDMFLGAYSHVFRKVNIPNVCAKRYDASLLLLSCSILLSTPASIGLQRVELVPSLAFAECMNSAVSVRLITRSNAACAGLEMSCLSALLPHKYMYSQYELH